ncbi:MAG: hypothetical protein JXR96_19445 [Deltaproteobacteria bacterium]|nr:hypothetical protein [Deltaproteobacteria bacterium]
MRIGFFALIVFGLAVCPTWAQERPAREGQTDFVALDLGGDEEPSQASARTNGAPPACLKREPEVRILVAAAWRCAGLLAEEDRSRTERVRTAGWLPKISGGVSMDLGDRWEYRYEPGEPRIDELKQDDGWSWEVDLQLDLGRAAYGDDELKVAREAVRRARERRDLAAEVVRLFFARRRLLLHGLPRAGSAGYLQLAEVTAMLDAWTCNRFAHEWCGREKP